MVCACEGRAFVWPLHAPVIIFERMRSGLPGGSANSRCAMNLASSLRMGQGIPEASRTRLYASSSMRDSIQTPSHGLRFLGAFEGLGIPRSSSTPTRRRSGRRPERQSPSRRQQSFAYAGRALPADDTRRPTTREGIPTSTCPPRQYSVNKRQHGLGGRGEVCARDACATQRASRPPAAPRGPLRDEAGGAAGLPVWASLSGWPRGSRQRAGTRPVCCCPLAAAGWAAAPATAAVRVHCLPQAAGLHHLHVCRHLRPTPQRGPIAAIGGRLASSSTRRECRRYLPHRSARRGQ